MPILEEVRTVTADGRVVIPWVIQRALGLEHGGPIRFHVQDGVVTLIAVEAQTVQPARAAESSGPRRTDVRAAVAAELRTLLEVAERDRAIVAATR